MVKTEGMFSTSHSFLHLLAQTASITSITFNLIIVIRLCLHVLQAVMYYLLLIIVEGTTGLENQLL